MDKFLLVSLIALLCSDSSTCTSTASFTSSSISSSSSPSSSKSWSSSSSPSSTSTAPGMTFTHVDVASDNSTHVPSSSPITATATSIPTSTRTRTTTSLPVISLSLQQECQQRVNDCYMKSYGVQFPPSTNLEEMCGNKKIHLKWCLNREDLQFCGDFKALSYSTLDNMCKHSSFAIKHPKCNYSLMAIHSTDVYRDCNNSLVSRSPYNNSAVYKTVSPVSGNTCLFENLMIKCEATAFWRNCATSTYYDAYKFFVDVNHTHRLATLGCDKYVDIPCGYRINFEGEVC